MLSNCVVWSGRVWRVFTDAPIVTVCFYVPLCIGFKLRQAVTLLSSVFSFFLLRFYKEEIYLNK